MTRVAATLAKLVATALATFLLLELVLLVANDVVFGRSFYGFDPEIGFRVRSHAEYGSHRANEFGFNDRDYPRHREPGTVRILVLSDSFNWTFGPEGNYVGLLERRFQETFPGRRVEVINAGYPQTHTAQQLVVLRKFGLQYEPDIVLLGFFVGNDFFDADPDRLRIVVGGVTTDVRPATDFYHVVFGQPLVWKSRFLLFLEERWNELRHVDRSQRNQFTGPAPIARVRGVPAPDSRRPGAEVTLSDGYLDWLIRRMEFARPASAARFGRFESHVEESLLAMRDLLRARGIGFAIAAYPDAVQVDPAVRRAMLARTGNPEGYEWDRAQSLLRSFCTEHDIAFHDLLPAFQAAQRDGWDLYLQSDSHWSAPGNVLAAELLFEILEPTVRTALEGHGGAQSTSAAAR